jgi:hypothetical protein
VSASRGGFDLNHNSESLLKVLPSSGTQNSFTVHENLQKAMDDGTDFKRADPVVRRTNNDRGSMLLGCGFLLDSWKVVAKDEKPEV